MKNVFTFIIVVILLNGLVSCRSTKKLQTAISRKDSAIVHVLPAETDSAKSIATVMENIKKNHIDFNTFSAKIKVDYTDSKGRQPDVNAFVRIKKDSLIWISINATFLNVEAFRVLISKDSILILNKLQKQVEYHSLDYLEEVAKIPLDFKTLQDLIIGNPIFLGKKIVAYKQTENRILVSTVDDHFKNLVTLAANNNLIERSKLDDINVAFNRTADLTYYNYENRSGMVFSTLREIIVAEKTRVDIALDFKQYDFNKDLSFPFSIPKNYKRK
ncbi:MAG: DUF4292 domain-containing protein [Chitinophagaceae bacterium]|nr:DUF4292 domain-containing protein [Chitinophagaceae bacterium]